MFLFSAAKRQVKLSPVREHKKNSISTSECELCKHCCCCVKHWLHYLHSLPQSHVITQDTTLGTPETIIHKRYAFSLVVP